ncbi:MAG: topoisomerase C-terminal repeat-containing protein [Methylophilaceae bacterium]
MENLNLSLKTKTYLKFLKNKLLNFLTPIRTLGDDPENKESIDIYKGRFGFYIQRGSLKVNLANKYRFRIN